MKGYNETSYTEIKNGKLRKNNASATDGGDKRRNQYFHILTNLRFLRAFIYIYNTLYVIALSAKIFVNGGKLQNGYKFEHKG